MQRDCTTGLYNETVQQDEAFPDSHHRGACAQRRPCIIHTCKQSSAALSAELTTLPILGAITSKILYSCSVEAPSSLVLLRTLVYPSTHANRRGLLLYRSKVHRSMYLYLETCIILRRPSFHPQSVLTGMQASRMSFIWGSLVKDTHFWRAKKRSDNKRDNKKRLVIGKRK